MAYSGLKEGELAETRARQNIKDKFWKDLNMVTESSRGCVFLAGDFDARFGKMYDSNLKVIENEGKKQRKNQ